MTLQQLADIINEILSHDPRAGAHKVVIPNHKPSIGPISVTEVSSVHNGFDWSHGKFFINPVNRMKEINNNEQ